MSVTMSHAAEIGIRAGSTASVATAVETTRPAKKPGSMGKIFLIVGLAIVIFMVFTAYSVQKEIQGSAQLAAIKDLYFPVLQRLDADTVRIDKMEELYIQVVVAGDRDSLGKANDLGAEADRALAQTAKLYPGRTAEVTKLRADLKNYQALATKAATAFLDQSAADPTSLTAGMNESLGAVRTHLKAFRQSSYDEFTQTLAGSEHDARVRLFMGLALGVMNLCFMAVLVYFIRNNMKMMTVIAEQNATLEHRVSERTAQLSQKTHDINAMLQNMKLGVSTVVPGNSIHPEYSNYLTTIFCIDNLAGKDLVGTLFAKSSLGVDAKDQVSVALGSILAEEAMMFDFNSHLLAREMSLDEADGTKKIVQMDWSPIVNDDGKVDKVLLITQDVTHLRELELSSAKQKEELDIIAKIIRISAGKFNEFAESAAGFLTANSRLIRETKGRDAEVITALFRNMHTIKGNARTFEFSHITDAAHRAEQTYDQLRKDPNAQWDSPALTVELEAVEAAVSLYIHVNEEKLGRKGRASELLTGRGSFVSNEQLAQLRSMVGKLAGAGSDTTQLRKLVDSLDLISLQRLVSGSVDSLASLASELKKPTPSVDILNGDVAFNTQFAEALKSSLMHILRNSLDHGIESPEERLQANKPKQGVVRFACVRGDGKLELHISDDGRGLALHKLYEKGVAGGLFAAGERPAREAIADIIFRSGLSTSSRVTQVSGRGVGMEAVRTFLKEQGASVRVVLAQSGPELGFTPFEFVIDVPASAYGHLA
jgi:HPt (histidine-containing phosphotransfer) domain-containing protein